MTFRWTAALLACLAVASVGRADHHSAPEDAPADAPAADAQDAADEGAADEGAAAKSARDMAGPRTPPYAIKLQEGIRLVLAHDVEAAATAFREAIKMDPRRPEPHYHLGVVQRMQGELRSAIDSFEAAARMAREDRPWQARALAAIAWTIERIAAQRPDLPEDADAKASRVNEPQLARAREAWQRVRDLAAEGGEPLLATAAATAEGRQKAIDALLSLEERTAPVRERIAERETVRAEEEAARAKKKK
jgi:tetratricopeptide (TPR) repeat protein